MSEEKDLKPLQDFIEQAVEQLAESKSNQGLSHSMTKMMAFVEFLKLSTDVLGPNTLEAKQLVKNIEDIVEKKLRAESYKSDEDRAKEDLWYNNQN